MKISIITINYNNINGLRRTIESVLAQTTHEFEWIVIDGSSTDGSRELIEKNSKHIDYWVSEPDKGIYNAMNKGIKVATGEYFLFLNSGDCFASHDVVEKVLPHLHDDDYIIANVAESKADGSIGKSTDYAAFINNDRNFWYNSTVNHQGMFIKGSCLKEHPYNENHKIVADWEHVLYQLFVKGGSFRAINTLATTYEAGGFSMTNYKKREEERRIVAEQYFEREFLDKKFLESLITRKYKNYLDDIANVACAISTDSRYDSATLLSILSPYRDIITHHGSLKVRTFNWLNLHHLHWLARTISKIYA